VSYPSSFYNCFEKEAIPLDFGIYRVEMSKIYEILLPPSFSISLPLNFMGTSTETRFEN
jgi:hypothetical protein